jgi:lipopolysaccharide export system protein LptA
MEGDSVLEDKKNKVVAKARYIEYDDPKETAVLEISVRIFKEKLVCRSQYALYQRAEKNLFLSGFPVVYKDQDEFRANTMKVNLDTEDIIMDGSVSGTIKGKKADDTATKP